VLHLARNAESIQRTFVFLVYMDHSKVCVTSGCNVRGKPIPVHSARYPLPEYSSQPTGDFSLVAEKWEPYWKVSVPKTPQGSCYFGYFCYWFVGSAPFEITCDLSDTDVLTIMLYTSYQSYT